MAAWAAVLRRNRSSAASFVTPSSPWRAGIIRDNIISRLLRLAAGHSAPTDPRGYRSRREERRDADLAPVLGETGVPLRVREGLAKGSARAPCSSRRAGRRTLAHDCLSEYVVVNGARAALRRLALDIEISPTTASCRRWRGCVAEQSGELVASRLEPRDPVAVASRPWARSTWRRARSRRRVKNGKPAPGSTGADQ